MSYKNEIKNRVQTIINQYGTDSQNLISITVVNEFYRILKLSKASGISLKYTTYSVLEGVDEALDEKITNKKIFLQNLSATMAEIAYKSAQENIEKINSLSIDKTYIAEKIENEKACLEDIAEGFKEYVMENGYHLLAQSVEKIQLAADTIKVDFHLRKS